MLKKYTKPPQMDVAELKTAMYRIFDGMPSNRKLAEAIKKSEVTVSRWVNGHIAVPDTETVLIRLMAQTKITDPRKVYTEKPKPKPTSLEDLF